MNFRMSKKKNFKKIQTQIKYILFFRLISDIIYKRDKIINIKMQKYDGNIKKNIQNHLRTSCIFNRCFFESIQNIKVEGHTDCGFKCVMTQ